MHLEWLLHICLKIGFIVNKKLKARFSLLKPYSVKNYRADAEKLIEDFCNDDRVIDNFLMPDIDGAMATLARVVVAVLDGEDPNKADIFKWPDIAGRWSGITRKRRAGVLLGWLLIIEHKEQLDMTPTLANNILRSMKIRSISNRELNRAFGVNKRTAADKSKDFKNIEQVVEKYSADIRASLDGYKEPLKLAKELAWERKTESLLADKERRMRFEE